MARTELSNEERVRRIKERISEPAKPICTQRTKYWTESWVTTYGQPRILRRAKALANMLEKIDIYIGDDELFLGNVASKPNGLEVDYWSGCWPEDELDGLKYTASNEEQYYLSEEDIAEIRRENKIWAGDNFSSRYEARFDDRLGPFMEGGYILPPWKKGKGWAGRAEGGMGSANDLLACPDYAKTLKGLRAIIDEAKEAKANIRWWNSEMLEKSDYWDSVIISLEAIITYAHRCADKAEEAAAKETDERRKEELLRAAAACRHVPEFEPRNFFEAMQAHWLIFLMCNPNMVCSLGRMDQYLYPYYKMDKDITDEDAILYFQLFRLNDMQIARTSSKDQRAKWAGLAKWHNCIIGGVKPEDGSDATNELSYFILEAALRTPTTHHTITVRVHDNIPEDFMLKAVDVLTLGVGYPAFISDNSNIPFLQSYGVSLEDAIDFVLAGCLDVNLPGKSRIMAYPMFVVPKVLECAFYDGYDYHINKQVGAHTGYAKNFTSFEEMYDAFLKQFKYLGQIEAERSNLMCMCRGDMCPDPVMSAFMTDGIEGGRDLMHRSYRYENLCAMNVVGMVNVANSLYAIKKLVFEDKVCTMAEMMDALEKNWEGYEDLREKCKGVAKYGNNIDEVDQMAARIWNDWVEICKGFPGMLGGHQIPTGISISAHGPGGALTGATPDGRCACEYLADGSMSPAQGTDEEGPLAVLNSALKLPQDKLQADLLNMKFHPTALKTREDKLKLVNMIETYMKNGGKQLQFNVTDKKVLLGAQVHPDDHKDLIVRIAGYSAYFTQLGTTIQTEIIDRTENEAVR